MKLMTKADALACARGWASRLSSALAAKADASHPHDAGDIASGTLAAARVPTLPASKITTGVLPRARGGTGADRVYRTAYFSKEVKSVAAGADATASGAVDVPDGFVAVGFVQVASGSGGIAMRRWQLDGSTVTLVGRNVSSNAISSATMSATVLFLPG